MKLMYSATAGPPSQSLSRSIKSTDLKSDDIDQITVLPVDWKWYLGFALMNLAGWLLLFGTLLFLAYYMQE